ncbi:hypothetical protein ONZ45_g12168 [Pleurotus djamor]|nr:hypothetical protein ONZ45_g12168 [Pleurotus djamor]
MTRALPYTLITAFSNGLGGGNPAAVVFLNDTTVNVGSKDINSTDDIPDDTTLQAIANNLNQPIVSYITGSVPTTAPRSAAFGIRWFALREAPLRGHGTIAAAKAIWSTPGMVGKGIETLEFHAKSGVVLKVTKAKEESKEDEGEWLEIQLPAGGVEPVDNTEKGRIADLVSQAIGKEAHIMFVGHGGNGFEYMTLIELDAADDLANCKINSTILLNSGNYVNILTSNLQPKRLGNVPSPYVCARPHRRGRSGLRFRGLSLGTVLVKQTGRKWEKSERGGDAVEAGQLERW